MFYFIASVLLNDPDNICGETNGGSHIKPGTVVSLLCHVDNTGAPGGNYLIRITPVSKIKSVIVLFLVLRLFWTMYHVYLLVCRYDHLRLLCVTSEIDE